MNLAPVIKQRFLDSNGLPLAGGLLYSYQAGTTTPQVTYSNSTGTTNTNPVVLDASGYADVWMDPTLSYKFILTDSLGNVQWNVDNAGFAVGITFWSANGAYQQGSIVADASGQGMLYVSLINNNQNNPLTNVSAWRVYDGNTRTVSVNTSLLVTDNFVRSNSTSGNLTHTLPACSTTPIGKEIVIKDVGTGGNATTLKGAGTDQIDGSNTYSSTLALNGSLRVKNNGASWDVISIPDLAVTTPKIATGAVTQAKLATRATGATVAAGGLAVSASCGSFSTASTTYVDVTNLTVTITTTGRPVFIGLINDGSGNAGGIYNQSASGNPQLFLRILRDGAEVSSQRIQLNPNAAPTLLLGVTPSSFNHIEALSAGTYVYKVQVKSSTASSFVEYTKLVAYEL